MPTSPLLPIESVFSLRGDPIIAHERLSHMRDVTLTRAQTTRRKWEAIKELARRDYASRSLLGFMQYMTPYPYQAGWFHKDLTSICDLFMQQVQEKKSPRITLSVPPGAGKSEVMSRYFPPYMHGHHPDWEIVSATYGQDLSDKFGRVVRDVINDPRYHELFPDTIIDKRSNSVSFIQTTARGNYNATSVSGALTGQRASVLIIDDPIKDQEEADSEMRRQKIWDWYMTVARTRLYPGGGIIIIATRWHEFDLIGRLHDAEALGGEKWTKISYSATAERDERFRRKGDALHPERYSREELLRIRDAYYADGNERHWNALYQQNPVAPEGNFFRREHIHIRPPRMFPDKNHTANYIAVDLAVTEKETADATCIWPFGVDADDVIWFSRDVFHGRVNSLDMIEALLDRARDHDALGILIEKGPITQSVMPLINRRMRERGRYHEIIEVPTGRKDKVAKAHAIRGRMAQEKVNFPNTPFMHETAVPELVSFPAGKHDDIVDVVSLAGLALDELLTGRASPAQIAGTDDDGREHNAWTYDQMKQRGTVRPSELDAPKEPHRFPRLNGKPRKRVKS